MERNKKYKDAVDTYYVYGGYNCAESVVLCARDLFHLNIAEKDIRLLSAFGGGMGCGKTCGALAGALAVLGHEKVEVKAHATEGFAPLCGAFVHDFNDRINNIDCEKIKPQYFKPDVRCAVVVETALEMLDEYLHEAD